MLRQYFMALRTIGKWQKLSDHWLGVASNVHHEPLNSEDSKVQDNSSGLSHPLADDLHAPYEDTWQDFIRARLGHTQAPLNEDTDFMDEDDIPEEMTSDESDISPPEVGADPATQMDIEILLMRKFWTRWATKAGVKSCPCDPVSNDACLVDWTRLIAPVVEGRIKMVQSK